MHRLFSIFSLLIPSYAFNFEAFSYRFPDKIFSQKCKSCIVYLPSVLASCHPSCLNLKPFSKALFMKAIFVFFPPKCKSRIVCSCFLPSLTCLRPSQLLSICFNSKSISFAVFLEAKCCFFCLQKCKSPIVCLPSVLACCHLSHPSCLRSCCQSASSGNAQSFM